MDWWVLGHPKTITDIYKRSFFFFSISSDVVQEHFFLPWSADTHQCSMLAAAAAAQTWRWMMDSKKLLMAHLFLLILIISSFKLCWVRISSLSVQLDFGYGPVSVLLLFVFFINKRWWDLLCRRKLFQHCKLMLRKDSSTSSLFRSDRAPSPPPWPTSSPLATGHFTDSHKQYTDCMSSGASMQPYPQVISLMQGIIARSLGWGWAPLPQNRVITGGNEQGEQWVVGWLGKWLL